MTTKTKSYPLHKVVALTPVRQVSHSSQIAIASKSYIRVIESVDILYLKADSNYTEIHFLDGRKILTSTTLKRYEDKLDPQHFMRVHKSYLVRRSKIETFSSQDNKIILCNTQEIPVSRSKKDHLLSYLKTLMV